MQMQILLANTKSDKTFALQYQLENHSVAEKYYSLIRARNAQNISINQDISFWNFNLDPDYLYTMGRELQKHIDALKDEPEIDMPYKVHLGYTQHDLNLMHADFEKYLNMINAGKLTLKYHKASEHALLQINILIHKIENFVRLHREIKRFGVDRATCSFGFCFQQNEKVQLTDKEYDLFTTEYFFGDLFCGYNTTGKHFLSCAYDNDIEVIRSRGVKPQRTFSTETLLRFGPYVEPEILMSKMRQWWVENNLDSYGYRFEDKSNAFGQIRLAKLIEPDEFKGKSHWEKLQVLDQFNFVKDCRLL